jgi:UDP-N-acetylglucosamine/UDP-N-acetylgalactosamine 4-epimerase
MKHEEDISGQTFLVTGGAGFIGSHLVEELIARGARVRVLDNFCTGHRKNLEAWLDRIELLEGDIRDLDTCRRAAEGVQHVLHQAALGSVPRSIDDPATSIAVNVGGTANVFAAARDAGIGRVVYASSSAVYGDSEKLPKREGQEGRPLSPYAVSKWMNEELAEVYARCYGMSFAGLRYFNVYGPRQDPNGPYAAVVPRFFDYVGAGKAPTIFGDGRQSRDFTFVKDVVEANLRAATSRFEGAQVFNIGAEGTTSVTDLAETIIAIMGADLKPAYLDPRPGDVLHSQADTSRARELLGYRPTTELAAGLAQTKPGA